MRSQFSALLFISVAICLIDCIMKENGKLYDVGLMLGEFCSPICECSPFPFLQHSEDVLISVIVPPVLRVTQEELCPAILNLFAVLHLQSMDEGIE